MDLRPFLGDDERVLELTHPLGVHAEVGLDRHLDSDVLGDVDEAPAGPDGPVQGGELVVARRHAGRHEVLFDELGMLPNGLIHVTEDDTFLLPLLLHVLVDDLGLVLGTDAGEGVLLGFGNAQLVERVLDLVGQLRPVVNAFALVDVRSDVRDDLFDVEFGEIRHAGPTGRHRHVVVLLERTQAALEHPVGLVLVLGDHANDLLGQAFPGSDRGVLFLLELEPGLGVCLL